MKKIWLIIIMCAIIISPLLLSGEYCLGGDLDDKISQYTDETIDADDQMGNDDPNINFIVLDAIAKAKAKMSKIDKEGKTSSNDDESNFSDGSGSSSNVNSVVVGPGSQVKDIYNIVIKK